MVEIVIDEILKKKNKTRYWLIKQADLTYETVAMLANNEKVGIQFGTLEKICKALECTPNDIIKFD